MSKCEANRSLGFLAMISCPKKQTIKQRLLLHVNLEITILGSVESNSTEGSDSLTSNQILNSNPTILKNGGPGPSDQASFKYLL